MDKDLKDAIQILAYTSIGFPVFLTIGYILAMTLILIWAAVVTLIISGLGLL